MPLLVICGHPSSGKSTIASRLSTKLQEAGSDVDIVSEDALHLVRSQSYATSSNEKITRGTIKAEVDKILSRRAVTIVDSLNAIKGYRYELWCLARAVGTTYCMVHVDTPCELCEEWNTTRPTQEQYPKDIFDDLWGRFERPDSRNRWDSPLFTVRPGPGTDEEMEAVLDDIVRAMVAGEDSNTGTAKVLQPTLATSNPTLLATNVLHDIDQATQEVIQAVMDAQQEGWGSGVNPEVMMNEHLPTLQLIRPVSLAELRRHKRAFLKLATKLTMSRLQGGETAKKMFLEYLRDHLAST